jgi:hypothetical protein
MIMLQTVSIFNPIFQSCCIIILARMKIYRNFISHKAKPVTVKDRNIQMLEKNNRVEKNSFIKFCVLDPSKCTLTFGSLMPVGAGAFIPDL